MTEYRTDKQFLEIVNSCLNGNWSQGANECVKYGFYANDLISKQKSLECEGFEDLTDMAILIEMATQLRF